VTPELSHVHGPGKEDCPKSACYRSLACPGADQAWGLGRYSIEAAGDSFFGSLVHDLKYELPSHVGTQRKLDTLAEQVSKFLRIKEQATFDRCVIVAGNRSSEDPIMLSVARRLKDMALVDTYELLLKNAEIPVMKGIDRSARALAISGKYRLAADFPRHVSKRVLVLDDVYDSGATLSEAVATVRSAAPDTYIVAIAATYLRDPRWN